MCASAHLSKAKRDVNEANGTKDGQEPQRALTNLSKLKRPQMAGAIRRMAAGSSPCRWQCDRRKAVPDQLVSHWHGDGQQQPGGLRRT